VEEEKDSGGNGQLFGKGSGNTVINASIRDLVLVRKRYAFWYGLKKAAL
jgi:hypothetical protein